MNRRLEGPAASGLLRNLDSAKAPGVFLLCMIVLGIASASLLDSSSLRLLTEMLIYLTLAQLWNLLAGYAGLVSVGQQAFVGLGGYAFFYFATALVVPPIPALLLGGLVGFAAATLASKVIFRLKGAHFAIGTWVVAEICLLTVAVIPTLGGGSGMSLPASIVRTLGAGRQEREVLYFLMAFCLATITIALIYVFMRSHNGLALMAARDSERAAESLGIDAMRIRRMVYIAVGFATALVGGLIFLLKLRMTQLLSTPFESAEVGQVLDQLERDLEVDPVPVANLAPIRMERVCFSADQDEEHVGVTDLRRKRSLHAPDIGRLHFSGRPVIETKFELIVRAPRAQEKLVMLVILVVEAHEDLASPKGGRCEHRCSDDHRHRSEEHSENPLHVR